jgi:hypothetical protein
VELQCVRVPVPVFVSVRFSERPFRLYHDLRENTLIRGDVENT